MTDLPPRLAEALCDRYRLERELGRGGMATVYLAHDLKHDRPVALKVLQPELAAALGPERFHREIRTAAALQHPHILSVFDSGESAGLLWYTMPFVEGESLRARLCREVQLGIEDSLRITRDAAVALDYAHRHGVVHRDIKPENILLSDGQALVADFGMARAPDAGPDGRLTEPGIAVGTPAYMSPEQSAAGQVDARSDQYSLACVLYEMLAGEPPFTGPNPQAVMARRLAGPVPSLRITRPDVPPELDAVIRKALAHVPGARFASAKELADRLDQAAAMTKTGSGATQAFAAPSLARPRRSVFGTAAFIAAGLAIIGLALASRLSRNREPATLDPNLVAVAPFDVLAPSLWLWHEGLVDLLSRHLDGAGPLRTVSPTLVVRRWKGRADRSSAEGLARDTGAGLALYGTLVAAGPDSVRLTISVLDAVRGQVLSELEVRGPTDRLDRLADSVTVRVLRGLGQTRAIGATRSAGLGSRSLTALRAFLRGEQYFRRTVWDSALASYEQALVEDTAFALAQWRMGIVRGWLSSADDSLSQAYYMRAGATNHGLAPRESLLVLFDSLRSELRPGPLPVIRDSAGEAGVQRLLRTADEVVRRYPGDPESWVALGSARFHFGHGRGITLDMVREAFDRAIALDSAYAPAYFHAVVLAVALGDPAAARQAAARYLALHPGREGALIARAAAMLLDPAAPRVEVDRMLDTMPAPALFGLYVNFWMATDSAETAIRIMRRLAARSVTEDVWYRSPEFRQAVLAIVLAYRGHAREAVELVTASDWLVQGPIFTGLVLLGHIPPDTADAIFRRRLARGIDGLGTVPAWWAARRDTMSIARYLQRLRELAGSRQGSRFYPRHLLEYSIEATEGYLALARGDSADAVARLRRLAVTTGWVWQERLTLARLLAALGRDREALAVLDLGFPDQYFLPGRVPWALEHARVAERLGQQEKALDQYGFVVDVWRRADPELRAYVDEARAGLQRLSAEGR